MDHKTVLSAWALLASLLVISGCARDDAVRPADNSSIADDDATVAVDESNVPDESSTVAQLSSQSNKAVSENIVAELRQLIEEGHHDQAIARVEEQIAQAQQEGQSNEKVTDITTYLASELSGTPVGAHCEYQLIHAEFEQSGLRRRVVSQLDQFLVEYRESPLPIQLYVTITDQMVENGQGYVVAGMLTKSINLAKAHRDVEPLSQLRNEIKERDRQRTAERRRQSRSLHRSAMQSRRKNQGGSTGKPSRTRTSSKYASLVGKRMRITGTTLNGKKMQPSRGWTVVHFWATWCPACRRNVPNLKSIQRQYDGRGVQLVGVSLDQDLVDLKRFNRRNGITWPQVVSRDVSRANWNSPLARKYGINSIPAVFLVSPAGTVVEAGLRGTSSIAGAIDYHLSPSS